MGKRELSAEEREMETGTAWAKKETEGMEVPGDQEIHAAKEERSGESVRQEAQEAKEEWKMESGERIRTEEEAREHRRKQEETAGEPNKVGRKKKKFRLKGSTAVKVTAFILLFVNIIVGVACGAGCYIAAEEGVYFGRKTELLSDSVRGAAWRIASEVHYRFENGYEDKVDSYLKDYNAEVAVLDPRNAAKTDSGVFLWKSYDKKSAKGEHGFYSDFYLDYEFSSTFPFRSFPTSGQIKYSKNASNYIFRVFIDPEMTADDEIRWYYSLACFIYDMRYYMIWILAGNVLLAIICFVFLLCSAGHRNGRSGITPGVLTGLHFDLVAAAFFSIYYVLGKCFIEVTYRGDVEQVIGGGLILLAAGILFMIELMDFAIRLKMGKWWRHTLTYVILRAVWRGLRFFVRGIWSLLRELPTVLKVMTIYLGICILELLGLAMFAYREEAFLLWGLEKVILFLVVLYIASACKKLLNASRELVEGREDYRVNTGHLFGALREHGENLNCLGQGISKAVAERMRSEHLKTELITNVSHDLKTPLTSIINYANLICEEKSENPKIAEYSEVLLRQSGRLKKLLENLVEASKATTGNLEVNLAPCEVGVLLTQAVGEYQQRMEEKGLELRDRQPEQPVRIQADGRHLWRVFDNLLNNICKYAQENTRVYLSLERQENKVFIIFRNMSKYALDISPEELEERFVRGDKSRHMEGNGLGLSIAKSLTELQGGKLDILIDGDLFKVTLTFPVLEE